MQSQAISLGSTMGMVFVGIIVASTLYGVSLVQTYFYCIHQQDTWLTKSLVTSVIVLETVHQALISHSIYYYLVINYDEPEMLGRLVWSILLEALVNGFIALLVKSFQTMRIWRLSNRNIWLASICALLVFGEFGTMVAFIVLSFQLKTWAELAQLARLSSSNNALAAVGDLLIAASLCTILHLRRTGVRGTDTIINKLILFSVNTGLLTSLCAVASFVSITTAGGTFIYLAFFICIGRLYSNSLLATLNARKRIRAGLDGTRNAAGSPLTTFRVAQNPESSQLTTKGSTNTTIKVDTTTDSNPESPHGCERDMIV